VALRAASVIAAAAAEGHVGGEQQPTHPAETVAGVGAEPADAVALLVPDGQDGRGPLSLGGRQALVPPKVGRSSSDTNASVAQAVASVFTTTAA